VNHCVVSAFGISMGAIKVSGRYSKSIVVTAWALLEDTDHNQVAVVQHPDHRNQIVPPSLPSGQVIDSTSCDTVDR
jgi:hypothetical protein